MILFIHLLVFLTVRLEENIKSTAGFELLADCNSFEIKSVSNCNIGKNPEKALLVNWL